VTVAHRLFVAGAAIAMTAACADDEDLRVRQAEELRRLCSAFILTDPDGTPADRTAPELSLDQFRLDRERSEPFNAMSLVAGQCLDG
jgi:hypothetical protein